MMKFKAIEFKEDNCPKIYDDYTKSIKKATKLLDKEESQEILMEFNSHIYESMQQESSKTELEKLSMAIDKLGNPQEVLKPLIADRLLEKATRTFNPIDVLRALFLNIKNGISYVLFSFLYLFLGGFVFLIFAKIFNNNNVGLFIQDGKFRIFGMTSNTNNYQEILGYWFIPLMLFLIVVLYLFITLLLKIKKSVPKKSKIQKASIFITFLFTSQILFAQNTVITSKKKEEIQSYIITILKKMINLWGAYLFFKMGKVF